jgi:diguanylate cyclase (GGDEF)-like protein/PAS domain S-box-containing protein
MKKFFHSPLFRISFSMTMLVISLLLASDFLGLFPKNIRNDLTQRKFIVETLAVHVAMELDGGDNAKISELLRTTVKRNPMVQSVAVRHADGKILDRYGNHDTLWTLPPEAKSVPTQVKVPLFDGSQKFGTVEIAFADINAGVRLIDRRASLASVVLFIAFSGFTAFCFLLKRTLRELDPDAVIPERVRKALDTLAEGLLIVNLEDEIIFSNAAFARDSGIPSSEIAGKRCDSLKWQVDDTEQLPWKHILAGREMPSAAKVQLHTGFEQVSTFTVSATPILARADEVRGVLITFNDITEVEIKNSELQHALDELKKSQKEIERQNSELEYLATRDPLTGSLNRRSFFNGFDSLFAEAVQNRDELTCLMTDIDKFKSVNDTHGHGVGDEVIKYLANVLAEYSRPNDLVGRFGGEEFCVVMPLTTLGEGNRIAEAIRKHIEKGTGANFLDKCSITASFGVASIHSGATKPNDMVEQADRALYVSKESGRNRVTNFSTALEDPGAAIVSEPVTDTPPIADVPALKVEPTPKTGSVPLFATAKPETPKPEPADTGAALFKSPTPMFAEPSISDNSSATDRPAQKSPVLVFSNKPSTEPAELPEQQTSDSVVTKMDRSLMLDRLEQALQVASRKSLHVAVMLVSVDALQRINDTLGFSVSEKLYQKILQRLRKTLKQDSNKGLIGVDEHALSVSRYGDSEICITLNHIQDAQDVAVIHERILQEFDKTISVDGYEVYIALETGVSIYPLNGNEADMLIRSASIAMRTAMEEDGQNSICYFSNEMNLKSRKLIHLETELHQALSRNELFVCYQPKVDLKTGTIVGMEALARWRHPDLGIVSPGEFIPVAERTGLINDISAWVTRVVCAQISIWREAGHKDLRVAVNISPAEMKNEQLADNILNAIREFDIPPQQLEVEVTESLVMQDMDQATRTLEKLDRNGVEISIDDFGTGFASLSYLKLFPMSTVKIDRSFVSDFARNPADARIVSGVIAMSHSLGIKVVCEGVENENQLRYLQDNHCDQVQGNLFSAPLQRQEATNLLANPGRIKRVITSYDASKLGLTAVAANGTETVITGVLNTFEQPGTSIERRRSASGS